MNADNKQIYERYKAQCNVDWGNDQHFYSANRYLIENLQSLKICPKCFSLYGKIRLWYGEWVEQRCHCDTKDESKWGDGRDFSIAYETCYCCGLEVIESGIKWSLFFCRDCKEAIVEFNDAVGRCVIPIGRHSLMNGVSLASKDIENRKAIADFIASSNSLGSRIDLAIKHKQSILQQRIKSFKLTDQSPIIDLIHRTQDIDLDKLKRAAFFNMLAFMINQPLSDTMRLYKKLMEHE